MDSLAVWAILLLLAGLLLLVLEVFIPSGGIIGTVAAGCFVISIGLAWQAWWPSQMAWFLLHLTALAVLVPAAAMLAFRIWPHTPMGRKAILAGPRREDVIPFQEEEAHLRRLIGKTGETATVLNPAGMVRIDHERLHCQSEGMILEAGVTVRVVGLRGHNLVVRRHDADTPGPWVEPEERTPLDFDLG